MSDPIEILERRLKAVLDHQATTRGLHFFCQLGGYDDELGIVTLQVSGSGNLLLSWRRSPDDVDLWNLKFTDEDYYQFVRLFMTFPFWSASPIRRGRNGEEMNIHLRISAQDIGTHQSLQFWSGDMEEFPVLKTLLTPLIKLIQSISRDVLTDEDLSRVLP